MRPLSLFLGALLCLSACGEDPVAGGSGTDAGNTLTVTARAQDGSAVAGAQVEVWPADEVPVAQGNPPTWSGTTDGQGTARAVVGSGRWSVLVRTGSGAFRKVLASGENASDTLRPYAVLTGFVKDASGGRIALPGLGRSVSYGADGRFVLDSLPSGDLSYFVIDGASLIDGYASLAAGVTASLFVPAGSDPGTDTLAPAGLALPLSIGGMLPDTGAFGVAFSVERASGIGTSWLFGWTSPAGKGIRLGCAGSDTLLLEVDGTLRRISGIPLDAFPLQMGLGWDGKALEVRLGGELLLSLSTSSPADRGAWTDPVIAPTGGAVLRRLAVHASTADSIWFASQLR